MNYNLLNITPDSYQKKIINSKIGSKLIWGSAASGKSLTLVWRAKKLIESNLQPTIICFSTHHRFTLKKLLSEFRLSEKTKVWTFKEWLIYELSTNIGSNITSYIKVINREETLLWLKKHQNKWSGNDDPEKDLEIIWHEKLYSPEGQPSDYKDLVLNYQEYLRFHHLVDEVDLYLLFIKKLKSNYSKNQTYFLFDEAQEATVLELQIMAQLLNLVQMEVFADFDQGVMAWRTPFSPLSLKEFKKLLKVKKYFYLKNNYFNSKQIINTGLKVLRKNKNRYAKRVKAISNKPGEMHFYLFETKEEEGAYLGSQIQKWLSDPLRPDDNVGVLVRTHQQAIEIAKFLDGILAAPYFCHTLLRSPSAQLIFASVRLVSGFASDADFDTLMNSWAEPKSKTAYFEIKKHLEPYQVYFANLLKNDFLCQVNGHLTNQYVLIQKLYSPTSTIDVYLFEKWSENEKKESGIVIIEVLDQGAMQVDFELAGETLWQGLKNGELFGYFIGFYGSTFYLIPGLIILKKNQLLNDTNEVHSIDNEIQEITTVLSQNKDLFHLVFDAIQSLRRIWSEQNPVDLLPLHLFCEFFEQKDALIDLEKINEIFHKTYLKHLTPKMNLERFALEFKNSSVFSLQNKGRLTLCTIHEGRKMKFQKIWVPRLHQFEFPHALSCSGEDLEEERRLFYVAFMRAEDTLILSSVKKENSISQFVRESGLIQGLNKIV